MFSPALRHRQQKLARHAAIAAGNIAREGIAPDMPDEGPVATEYQQLLAALHENLRTLHGIESIENKIAFKAKAIDAYLPWCEGALTIDEGTHAPQDEIVVTMMIWALDIARWELALDLAQHITSHGLQMPAHYHRGAAGMVVSEMADAAIEATGTIPHELLERARFFANSFDMKDNYRARLHRALGDSRAHQAENFDPTADSAMAGGKPALVDAALGDYRRALKLDSNVGVKKQIEQLEREAKKLAAAASVPQPQAAKAPTRPSPPAKKAKPAPKATAKAKAKEPAKTASSAAQDIKPPVQPDERATQESVSENRPPKADNSSDADQT